MCGRICSGCDVAVVRAECVHYGIINKMRGTTIKVKIRHKSNLNINDLNAKCSCSDNTDLYISLSNSYVLCQTDI